jgi:aspartate/methionine/tyrosine aminotransferase
MVSKRGAIAPFMVMDVMNAAAALENEGRSIIHAEVGQPSVATPLSIRNAVKTALDEGKIGYTLALGLPALRARIAQHYAQHYGVSVALEQVCVTMGSSSAFILSFLALFDVGDRVALATPCYPAYKNILESLGVEIVFIETTQASRWAVTPEMLAKAHRETPLKGLLIASPANPTGVMMTPVALQALAQMSDKLGIYFISDEIYHGLEFGEIKGETALKFSSQAIVINSFSKYYAMTGWRIGFMIVPPALSRTIERLAQNLFISPPYLSQIAGLAAFDAGTECEEIKEIYAKNRDILNEGLPQAGFTTLLPNDGAFYIYADVRHLTNDSLEFSRRMLNQAGVAATSGLDFDPARGNHYIRFSFAGSNDEMHEAIVRLKAWQQRNYAS